MIQDDFKASIIITSYNNSKYLVEAVESVMAQTLRPHEIIIADDGSTDNSKDIIDNFTARYPGWIKAIFQPQNVGIPKNRNAALRSVTGNFVGILDGDDLFLPGKMERQFQALCKMPGAKAIYSNFQFVESDGVTSMGLRYAYRQPQGDIFAIVAMLNYAILRTLIVDYESIMAVGFMDERYPKFDGLWLTIKLAAICEFAYVHEPLVLKREHPGGDSRQNTTQELLHDLLGIYRDMQPLLASKDQITKQAIHNCWQSTLSMYGVHSLPLI